MSRMEVGLDYEYGMAIYEISFRRGWMEYDYEINAQTGAIIKAERDTTINCAQIGCFPSSVLRLHMCK